LSARAGGINKNTNLNEPWATYDGLKPQGIRLCQKNSGEAYYACFFMPDSDGTRQGFFSIYEP
jgi:hypothetical protein